MLPLPDLLIRTAARWRTAQAGDVRLRYLVEGHGPPVVLLHGLSGSVRWWGRNIPALAQDYRVHALDLVHYAGGGGRFALRETARRLAGWIESLALGPVGLVGHSMGGAIAAELAADYPQHVRRLVLANPAVLFPPQVLPLSPQRLLSAGPRFPLTLVPVLVEDALRAGPRLLWETACDVLGNDLREKLAEVQRPALVIWGRHDPFMPVETAAELARLMPRCEYMIVDGAGHNPMWERAEVFNEAVREFFGRAG